MNRVRAWAIRWNLDNFFDYLSGFGEKFTFIDSQK
jgi:hypothetical protein